MSSIRFASPNNRIDREINYSNFQESSAHSSIVTYLSQLSDTL